MRKRFHGWPMKKYLTADAVSASDLKEFIKSPRHYQDLLKRRFAISTAALIRGTRLHSALEDWDQFIRTTVISPKFDRRTKDGRLAAQEWEAEHASMEIISADEMAEIAGMRESLFAEPKIRLYLEDFQAGREVVWRWINPESGLACKCRTDLEDHDGAWVLDYKTCQDASPDGFLRTVKFWGYDLSAAHYIEGTECERYGWIAVESKPPYACCLYWLSPSNGFRRIQEFRIEKLLDLNHYKCRPDEIWPSYCGGEGEIVL